MRGAERGLAERRVGVEAEAGAGGVVVDDEDVGRDAVVDDVEGRVDLAGEGERPAALVAPGEALRHHLRLGAIVLVRRTRAGAAAAAGADRDRCRGGRRAAAAVRSAFNASSSARMASICGCCASITAIIRSMSAVLTCCARGGCAGGERQQGGGGEGLGSIVPGTWGAPLHQGWWAFRPVESGSGAAARPQHPEPEEGEGDRDERIDEVEEGEGDVGGGGDAEGRGHVGAAAVPGDERRGDGGGIAERARKHHRREAPRLEGAPEHAARQHDGDVLVGGEHVGAEGGADECRDQRAARARRGDHRPDQPLEDARPLDEAAEGQRHEDQPDGGEHARHAAAGQQLVDGGLAGRGDVAAWRGWPRRP